MYLLTRREKKKKRKWLKSTNGARRLICTLGRLLVHRHDGRLPSLRFLGRRSREIQYVLWIDESQSFFFNFDLGDDDDDELGKKRKEKERERVRLLYFILKRKQILTHSFDRRFERDSESEARQIDPRD